MRYERAFLIVILWSLPALACAEPLGALPKVRPFPLERVRLLESPFKAAMELNKAYLLELDPDRLLWPFHERAGLPTKGERYGGWAMRDCVGHEAGHYLSACALMYASTGDAEIKKRVDYMVREMAAVQRKHGNGYAGPVRTEVWDRLFSGEIQVGKWNLCTGYVPWYVLHKCYAGLIDAYVHTGNETALEVARAFGDWAKQGTDKLDDAQFQRTLACEFGGMGEAMANLSALTGSRDFLDLARRFDHQEILDPLAAQQDSLEGQHANTLIPKILSAARLHELTAEDRYAAIARFFWDRAVNTRSFATGGIDFAEHFRAAETESPFLDWNSGETCAVHNMLKLTRHLFGWKPDAAFMDYYERALYNHILGSQDPQSGGFTYFYSLKPGHFKIYSRPFDSMWCCVGTGMENHAKYGESIYFHDDETLWVNLFVPSELDWKEKGVKVRLDTNFPEEETLTLKISAETEQPFAIKIRVPYWAQRGVEVQINGKAEAVAATPQSYLTLSRTWKSGDTIRVRLPMAMHLYRARDDKDLVAIFYGPLVLAGALGQEGMPESVCFNNHKAHANDPAPPVPVLAFPSEDLATWIRPANGERLQFRTVNAGKPSDVSLIPLYRLHHQRYAVYWRTKTSQ